MIELCQACDWLIDYGMCGCPSGNPLGPIIPVVKINGEWVPDAAARDRAGVLALLDERDRLFAEARNLAGPSFGRGLSFAQSQKVGAAQRAHREAVEMMAATHPLYRVAPWEAANASPPPTPEDTKP